ncbi:MAG: hypothetical protein Q8L07_04210 [Sediminibacterium sp.]|nr:hypothetical protein [Sediminibacterium sp.]
MANSRKLPRKPKMPKESASVGSWEKYHERLKLWAKKCADIKKDAAKKKALIAKAKKA